MSTLSVVILCGQSPRHLYFANKLCHACDPKAIIQESGHNLTTKKILRLISKPQRLAQKIWRWLRDRKRYTGNKEESFFFGKTEPKLERKDLRLEVPHINHPDVLSIVEKHNPDLIAVFGTSLIKGELLGKGRLGIVNLHGGLSPEYRGADCTFWALYNREPEKIGCTIHYINAGIDTGDLIAHVSPEVKETDDELILFWRAVRNSTGVFAELLDRLEKGEQLGATQKSKGQLYQVKDRQLKHEQRLDKLINDGLLNGLSLDKRIAWFHPPANDISQTRESS